MIELANCRWNFSIYIFNWPFPSYLVIFVTHWQCNNDKMVKKKYCSFYHNVNSKNPSTQWESNRRPRDHEEFACRRNFGPLRWDEHHERIRDCHLDDKIAAYPDFFQQGSEDTEQQNTILIFFAMFSRPNDFNASSNLSFLKRIGL